METMNIKGEEFYLVPKDDYEGIIKDLPSDALTFTSEVLVDDFTHYPFKMVTLTDSEGTINKDTLWLETYEPVAPFETKVCTIDSTDLLLDIYNGEVDIKYLASLDIVWSEEEFNNVRELLKVVIGLNWITVN